MKKILVSVVLFFSTLSCFSQHRDSLQLRQFIIDSYAFHLNVMLDIGVGFKDVSTYILTQNDEEVKISHGGGGGLGLQLGYTIPMSPIDISVSATLQASFMEPVVQNANGYFTRILIEPMAKYLYRIKKGKSSINAGVGIAFAQNPTLELDKTDLGGYDEVYKYKNATGLVILGEYQFKIKRISLTGGFKYYSIKYSVKTITGNGYPAYTTDPNYINADGSGLDFRIGFGYYF